MKQKPCLRMDINRWDHSYGLVNDESFSTKYFSFQSVNNGFALCVRFSLKIFVMELRK